MSQYFLFSLVPWFPTFFLDNGDEWPSWPSRKQKWKIRPISILRTNPNLLKCNSLLNSSLCIFWRQHGEKKVAFWFNFFYFFGHSNVHKSRVCKYMYGCCTGHSNVHKSRVCKYMYGCCTISPSNNSSGLSDKKLKELVSLIFSDHPYLPWL